MRTPKNLQRFLLIGLLGAALTLSVPVVVSAQTLTLDPDTRFYVPKPNHDAIEQIADLTSSRDKADANLIKKMIQTPQAVWFTGGTPKSVKQDVKNTDKGGRVKGDVGVKTT